LLVNIKNLILHIGEKEGYMSDLLALSKEEYEIIIEGLEAFKSKDFASEMIGGLLEGMLIKKDKMSPEDLKKYELQKEKEKIEKELKNKQKEELNHKADLIKAKILLMQDLVRN